ncbi:hypothetical protein DL96DRAFT_1612257 [Flagelloscypha sp. PMI_526]|nr:hypothetical protein DL96DRAFT_1612257 [Flagelloscypha sp. PMI_526]
MSLHSIYDLTTLVRPTTGDVPAKLVGASTTVVGSKMYLFGGRLVSERRMVSDLYSFNLETFHWEKLAPHPDDDVPRARYFHSADTWNNQLIIFGGMSNQPDSLNPDELCVLNDTHLALLLRTDSLVPRARYAHLSSDFFNTWLDDVCVYDLVGKAWVQRREYPRHCGTYRSVAVSSNSCVRLPHEELSSAAQSSPLGPPGSRFRSDDSLVHLPYSSPPTESHPSDIYLYSNYNFTDVKRELEVFSPLPDTDFTISDRSSAMTGTTFPPGLRFPTGAILGTHLIIAGTYLAHSYQSFSIWGKAVETGSWFRGSLWAEANKFLIFGNRHGNLVDDYNRRLLSWDHVAVVDLEAFGIYQPPPLTIDVPMQELGLAALEEKVFTDFDIICDDGRKIGCSRKLLEERWPWLKDQFKVFNSRARDALQSLPASSMHVALPDLPGSGMSEAQADPRLTPRSFHLSEPYPITLALMQYFYSLALITPLQHAPAVLSQLLVLATNYKITHLESLVGVYEVATLCSCRSLQIRFSCTQKRPARPKDKTSGGGSSGRPPEGGAGGSNGPSNGPPNDRLSSRPRGTSDAKWPTNGNSGSYSSNQGARKFTTFPTDHSTAVDLEDDELAELQSFNVRRRPSRNWNNVDRSSTISMNTYDEVHAVAELMSPTLISFTHSRSMSMNSTLADSEAHYMETTVLQPQLEEQAEAEAEVEAAGPAGEIDAVEALYQITQGYMEPDYDDDVLHAFVPQHSSRQELQVPPSSPGFHLPRRLRPSSLTPTSGSSQYSDTPSLVESYDSIASQSSASSIRTPSIASTSLPLSDHPVLEPVPERQEASEWMLNEEDDIEEFDRNPTPSQDRPSHTKPLQKPTKIITSGWSSPKMTATTFASPIMSMTPRLWTSSPTRNSDDFSLSSRANRSLSKLLSPTKSKAPSLKLPSATASTTTLDSTYPIESKAAKAEEKRRKKEEARAKTACVGAKVREG